MYKLRCLNCGFIRWGDQHEQDKRWKITCAKCGWHAWEMPEAERIEAVKILTGKKLSRSQKGEPR